MNYFESFSGCMSDLDTLLHQLLGKGNVPGGRVRIVENIRNNYRNLAGNLAGLVGERIRPPPRKSLPNSPPGPQ
jgi:hypothetical protein